MRATSLLLLSWGLFIGSCRGQEELSISTEGFRSLLPRSTNLFPELSRSILHKRQEPGSRVSGTSTGKPLTNFQVTQPPVVPQGGNSCRQTLLQTTFANSAGKPARISYSPPKACGSPGNWAAVILTLSVTSQGTQFDRLSSIFLNEVEIMRTSTPEPLPEGILWTIEKDVTKYIPLLALPQANLVMRLDNVIDKSNNIDGEFNVDLSATFYMPTTQFPVPVLPAAIIPLSGNDSTMLTVPSAATIPVQIPQNTVSALVEIYASGSEKEEFWYTNSIKQVAPVLPKNSSSNLLTSGPFREVQLWIDDHLAGVAYPFPVIFTGGMLLTWWRPMAAYGSLDQPTYTIDVTPFLPMLTDSTSHNFTLTVSGQGKNNTINSKWFLSGNIAVTLDPSGSRTTGKILNYATEPLIQVAGGICGASVHTDINASRKFFIESYIVRNGQQRKVSFKQDLLYQNRQNLAIDGSTQEVAQLSTGSSVSKEGSLVTFSDDFSFPLNVKMENLVGGLQGDISLNYNRKVKPGVDWFATSIQTTQVASGTLLLSDNGRSDGGVGRTRQLFLFTDERGSSFSRDVAVNNATEILKDIKSGSLSKT